VPLSTTQPLLHWDVDYIKRIALARRSQFARERPVGG
jgi:hypothetical protein